MQRQPRLHGTYVAAALAAALVACSGSNNPGGNYYNNNPPPGGGADMTMLPDLAEPPYPMGDNGNQTGNVLPNHTLMGYRLTTTATDSTKLPFTNISLADYHANSNCKCLQITVGALWCGACQQEQGELIEAISSDPSFCVLGVVQQGAADPSSATKADVDTWTQKYMQNFFVAQGDDTTNNYPQGYAMNGIIGLPFNLVVTPADMKVVGSWQGYDSNGHAHAMQLCGM